LICSLMMALPILSSATSLPNVQMFATLPAGNGSDGYVGILNISTGAFSACNTIPNSGNQPFGSCGSVGSVGKSQAGYTVVPLEYSFTILNKSNGNLFQCVPSLNVIDKNNIYSSTTSGQCQLIGNTANM